MNLVTLHERQAPVHIDQPSIVDIWVAGRSCPQCGRHGSWRMGQEFDHQMRCPDCSVVWEPSRWYLRVIAKVVKAPPPDPVNVAPHDPVDLGYLPIDTAPHEHGVDLLLSDGHDYWVGYWSINRECWRSSETGDPIHPTCWKDRPSVAPW